MTSVVSDPAAESSQPRAKNVSRRRIDATALLTVYMLLLMGIPADIVLKPIGAAGGPSTLFALIIFFVYLGLWLRPGRNLHQGRQPMRLAAILFVCVMVASYVSANRHALPVLQKNGADRGLIFTFGWIGITLLAADGIDSFGKLRTIFRRQVLGVTLMAIMGGIEAFSGVNMANYIKIPGLTALAPVTDFLTRGSFTRPYATASHPIEFGAVLAMTLPFAIHQARFASAGKRRRRWVQVGIIAMVAPMTVSRSTFLGLFVSLIVLLPTWSKRERRITYAVLAAGMGALSVALPGLLSTIGGLVTNIGSDPSARYRTEAIAKSWSYVVQNPWLGRGFGTFQPGTYFFVDDQYIMSMIETGIIGLLALIMIFVAGWVMARGARRVMIDAEDRSLGQTIAASVAVAAVSFSNYTALSFPVASGLTFLLLGCNGAYWRFAMQGKRLRQQRAIMTLQFCRTYSASVSMSLLVTSEAISCAQQNGQGDTVTWLVIAEGRRLGRCDRPSAERARDVVATIAKDRVSSAECD